MNWSEPAFAAIAGLLTPACGTAFPPSRRAFAEAAFRRAIAAAGERRAGNYLARLASETKLLEALIAEVSVGETYFFRDPAQFDVIRSTVLPALLRTGNRPLRIWSAGCSTGEEAYSLAMLLDDCGLADRARIFASDISPRAIQTALRGRYGPWSFRGDGTGLERRFARSGNRWTVGARFRRIDFRVHNLLHGGFAGGGFDLIVCRNVLLYFDRAAGARATLALAGALAPGGWLVTSPTDPPPTKDAGFEPVLTPAGVIFRRAAPGATAAPPPANHGRSGNVRPVHVRPSRPPRAPASPAEGDVQLALALTLLDTGRPHEAAVAARRALFLDRSLAVAHLTLARALRLTGRRAAAQRALEHSVVLLDAHPSDDLVRGGDAPAGTLRAVAAAELELLTRRAVS
jgi:chemotaxis protein methyltransferase CheR